MSDYYQFRDETGTPIDYYQLVNDNGELCKEIESLQKRIDKLIENWNILKRHFEFLKINTTGGNKEFMEEILEMMNILDGGENNR